MTDEVEAGKVYEVDAEEIEDKSEEMALDS